MGNECYSFHAYQRSPNWAAQRVFGVNRKPPSCTSIADEWHRFGVQLSIWSHLRSSPSRQTRNPQLLPTSEPYVYSRTSALHVFGASVAEAAPDRATGRVEEANHVRCAFPPYRDFDSGWFLRKPKNPSQRAFPLAAVRSHGNNAVVWRPASVAALQ